MPKEHVSFFRQLNEKVKKMNELIKDYNEQINKLHDVILIIHELKVELKEENLSENVSANSNTFLFIIENEVIVFITTFKKLFDSSVFIDDNNLIIED
jgi:hypothetical protein